MRTLRIFLTVAILAIVCGPAQAWDHNTLFSDCEYWKNVADCTVGADTLWFTTGTPTEHAAAALQAADWFGTKAVPIRVKTDGDYVYAVRRPTKVFFYSELPFYYKTFYTDGTNSGTAYMYADTMSVFGRNSSHGERWPCHTMITYMDSVYIKEAGSDTVRCIVGY